MGSTFGRCCVRDCCGPGSQCCAEADAHWHMQDGSLLFRDDMPADYEYELERDADGFVTSVTGTHRSRVEVPTFGELRAASVNVALEPLRAEVNTHLRSLARSLVANPGAASAMLGAALVPGMRSAIVAAIEEEERQMRADLLAMAEPGLTVADAREMREMFARGCHAAIGRDGTVYWPDGRIERPVDEVDDDITTSDADELAEALAEFRAVCEAELVRVWSALVRGTRGFMRLVVAPLWRWTRGRRAR